MPTARAVDRLRRSPPGAPGRGTARARQPGSAAISASSVGGMERARRPCPSCLRQEREGLRHLPHALDLHEPARVDERVVALRERRAAPSGRANDASGKFCTTTVLPAGELRARSTGVAATMPSTIRAASRSTTSTPADTSGRAHRRDPVLAHDLLGHVLVDVVDDAAAAELQQHPDPQQLGVVEVVDVGALAHRGAVQARTPTRVIRSQPAAAGDRAARCARPSMHLGCGRGRR